jgi:hypothetical protein
VSQAPSLADVHLQRLTPRAQWVFEHIAQPITEDDLTRDEVAARLTESGPFPWTPRMVKQELEYLGEQMKASAVGGQMPDLQQDDYDALKESIRNWGQLVPILVDANGQVIDGENRTRACHELNITPWTVKLRYVPKDKDERHAIALAVNLARRHLSSGQRRKVVEAELIRYPEQSDRAIATALGVSHPFVGKVRRELASEGQLETVTSSRRGLDGKVRALPTPSPAGEVAPLPELVSVSKAEYEALLELEHQVSEVFEAIASAHPDLAAAFDAVTAARIASPAAEVES